MPLGVEDADLNVRRRATHERDGRCGPRRCHPRLREPPRLTVAAGHPPGVADRRSARGSRRCAARERAQAEAETARRAQWDVGPNSEQGGGPAPLPGAGWRDGAVMPLRRATAPRSPTCCRGVLGRGISIPCGAAAGRPGGRRRGRRGRGRAPQFRPPGGTEGAVHLGPCGVWQGAAAGAEPIGRRSPSPADDAHGPVFRRRDRSRRPQATGALPQLYARRNDAAGGAARAVIHRAPRLVRL